jgi:hypothetical protein
LIGQLLDPAELPRALLDVQDYPGKLAAKGDVQLIAKLRAVIERADVRRAIDKVGRVEKYSLENPVF